MFLASATFSPSLSLSLSSFSVSFPEVSCSNTLINAATSYILDNYDSKHELLPTDQKERVQVREWLHAAEGTFMLHGLAILYARWKIPDGAKEYLAEMEEGMSGNIRNDMNWIEGVLKEQKSKGNEYLVGKHLTVADVMMGFSIEFITTRKLGVKDDGWPETRAWLQRCLNRPAYKKAVERSGYTLESHGKFKT